MPVRIGGPSPRRHDNCLHVGAIPRPHRYPQAALRQARGDEECDTFGSAMAAPRATDSSTPGFDPTVPGGNAPDLWGFGDRRGGAMSIGRTLIPDQLRPRMPDLPRLAWIYARAESPHWLVALFAYPIALGVVTGMAAIGAVAATRRALVTVGSPSSGVERAKFIAGGVVGAGLGYLPFLASALLAGSLLITPSAASVLPVHLLAWLAAAPAGAPILGCLAWLVRAPDTLRAQAALSRASTAGRPGRADERYARVGNFAAWPQRRGYGSGLLEELLDTSRSTDGSVVLVTVARNEALANWYQRLGMVADPLEPRVLRLRR